MSQFNVSEHFYSVQCEGMTAGYPAYFIRLANCNLSCGASREMIRSLKLKEQVQSPGDFKGDLHSQGQATWTCDTIPVWINGGKISFQDMLDAWKDADVYDDIINGDVNLIFTGGEPTMLANATSIMDFYQWLPTQGINMDYMYWELETNGTNVLIPSFLEMFQQINCSPKLANSGMDRDRRINSAAIKSIQEHPGSYFKFVISNEEDLLEIFDDFILPFNINKDYIIIMPGLDSQKDFHERTRFILEMTKKYKFRSMPRLHISAWDKTTGV